MSFGVRAKPPPFIVPAPEPERRPLLAPYLAATGGVVLGCLLAVGLGQALWTLLGRKGVDLAALAGPTAGVIMSMLLFGVPSLILGDVALSLLKIRAPLAYALACTAPVAAAVALLEALLPGRQYDPLIILLVIGLSMSIGGGVLGIMRRPKA